MLKKILLIITILLILLIVAFIMFVLAQSMRQAYTDIQENFVQLVTEIAETPEIEVDEAPECSDELRIFLFDYDSDIWDEYTTLIHDAACDVDYFWSQIANLPAYEPPEYIVQEYVESPHATPDNLTFRTFNESCLQPEPDVPAYYCPPEKGITIVQPIHLLNYMEWELGRIGNLINVKTMAHEWGHHIQELLAIEDSPNIELQAECFTGLYFNYAVNNSNLTQIDISSWHWTRLIPLPSMNEPKDLVANQSGRWEGITIVEQAEALQLGYEGDLSACLERYGINSTTGD